VSFENKLLGKPESPEHAFTMLKMLSGRKHQVVTALALVCEELDFERVELAVADVYFAQSTDRQIWDYIETGDPMDKAGGYGIQSPEAAFLFDHFEGDKTAIIGLPVELTRQMLEREAIL
jgi:septum formation protein